ncbi:Drug/metabolite transporter [Macleaya cordata]|uniref:Probable purine permease n=1 Tax=Macleaya cordata TaxID=56857 RepID=A0A200Q9T8_MACCD|nr:Drug/metabolite transporter [Macleaya cordata]
MAMSIERIEEGALEQNNHHNKLSDGDYEEDSKKSLMAKWGLLLLNCTCSAVGTIGGPLLLRLYFLHGGSRKWLSSWLQTAGFPILLIPLLVLYFRDRSLGVKFFASPKLLLSSAVIGVLLGLDNFMYSYGLSFLPVSTSSLLISTQLIFTALFAFIMVRQKFTPYSINSVVLMTLGSILLGLRKSGDRPPGVSTSQYLLGFILSIGAAALGGFVLPCTEVAYAKASKAMTYSLVLQYQFCMTFFATVFCTVGMLVNKDFSAMQREASEYELGATKYYLVLVSSAVVWQLMFVGTLGIIFCTSSLFAGVITATLLPLTEIAAVIVFHEKFTGEKGMALALGIWGFISYFYGSYRENKKNIQSPHETNNTSSK